jgi:maleylacetate reductase
MNRDDVAKAAEIAIRNPYWNPVPVERAAIETLIARAWEGARPT